MEQNNKICSICGEEKSLNEFYFNKQYSKKRGNYRSYYPYCKECTKKKSSKWTKENSISFQESQEKRKTTVDYKEYHKKYNDNRDKEKRREYLSAWQKEHADIVNIHNQNRRNTKKQLRCDLTFEQWKDTLNYFNNSCAYCGMSEEESYQKYGQHLHQDHLIPMSQNGEYIKLNIIPACRACNTSKHNADMLEWYRKQEFYNEGYEALILNFVDINKNIVEQEVI